VLPIKRDRRGVFLFSEIDTLARGQNRSDRVWRNMLFAVTTLQAELCFRENRFVRQIASVRSPPLLCASVRSRLVMARNRDLRIPCR
jgi:hypothetical protein